jgi:hypothetical protein
MLKKSIFTSLLFIVIYVSSSEEDILKHIDRSPARPIACSPDVSRNKKKEQEAHMKSRILKEQSKFEQKAAVQSGQKVVLPDEGIFEMDL